MPIVTLNNNTGTVGVPFSGTFTISEPFPNPLVVPYLLQLNSGTLPTGLTNGLVTMKQMGQTADNATGTQGEVVDDTISGGQGILIFQVPYGTDGWSYIPLNATPFSNGDNVYGQYFGGDLGVVDAPTINSFVYGTKLTLPPTLPSPITSLFQGLTWTIAGVPTTAGVYNFQLRVFNGVEQLFSGFQFQITITQPTKKKRRILAPPTICCDPNSFARGTCPPVVNHKGYEYVKIEGSNNCYIKTRRK